MARFLHEAAGSAQCVSERSVPVDDGQLQGLGLNVRRHADSSLEGMGICLARSPK